MNIFLVAVVFILMFGYFFRFFKRPKNFPPGPPWFPIIGNHLHLKSLTTSLGNFHLVFSHLSRTHKTKILGLKLGSELIIAVSTYSLIREVFTREEFEGRPENFFLKLRSLGRFKSGLTGNDGIPWITHRNFIVKHFRSLGFAKPPMETMVQNEIEEMVQILKDQKSGIKISKFTAPGVLNVLWTLVSGKRISRQESFLDEILDMFGKRGMVFDITGGPLNYYPWLRFLAPGWSGYSLVKNINKKLKKMVLKTITEHYETWEKGKEDDLIYAYISEIKKNENSAIFCEEELIVICFDLFLAGTQITSISLDLVFFMMILYPEIKEKVQKEIDREIPKEVVLNYSDRKKLPYTMAVLMEVQRFRPVAPIGGPRRTLKDTHLGGFFIPKDTTVFLDYYSLQHDGDYWGDPQVFRPERFLNQDMEVVTPERFIPFGLGRRRCVGDILAKKCIFHFFVEIMRRFNVSLSSDSTQITGNVSMGIILNPEKYKVTFSERC